jgi:putative restriction endonuclease
MPLTLALATLLEKAATDNGFDVPRPPSAEWISFGSTHAPLRVWLGVDAHGRPVAALSREDVGRALDEYGSAAAPPWPTGAVVARAVADIPALHRLIRRAFQLANTLPDELLHKFERATAALPRATEAERLVMQRVGQDVFREGLLEYWDGRCAVTGLAIPELLRASHIKPWADCDSDADRLDVFNGLLLAPHVDAAFDGGFVTFDDSGALVASEALPASARTLFGLDGAMHVSKLTKRHIAYLRWHRQKVFRQV